MDLIHIRINSGSTLFSGLPTYLVIVFKKNFLTAYELTTGFASIFGKQHRFG